MNFKIADPSIISKYASTLAELDANPHGAAIKPIGANAQNVDKGITLQRYYAVVVEKGGNGFPYIKVLFCNLDNGKKVYCEKKYVVSSSCSTDGKNLMEISAHGHFGAVSESDSCDRVGGITRRLNNMNAGEETSSSTSNIEPRGVGGITRIQSDKNVKNVGGITRLEPTKKIGGITRLK